MPQPQLLKTVRVIFLPFWWFFFDCFLISEFLEHIFFPALFQLLSRIVVGDSKEFCIP